jgi:hypothetical protein
MGKIKQSVILIILALIGWALCGAIIGIGRSITSMENILIIHAIAVPILFAILSFIYFRKFKHASPFKTAAFFMLFVIFMDAFIIAPFVEKSFDMFTSILGTWTPFLLIFASTYFVGLYNTRRSNGL